MNHPWFVGVSIMVISITLSSNVYSLKNSVAEAVAAINTIRDNTEKLNKCLEGNIRGGQDVLAGINSKDLTEHFVYVFDDNTYSLKPGNEIYLTNHIDDRFQTTIKCMIARAIPRNGDNTKAAVFLSKLAATKLGLFDNPNQQWQGVYQLKMKIKTNDDLGAFSSGNVTVPK